MPQEGPRGAEPREVVKCLNLSCNGRIRHAASPATLRDTSRKSQQRRRISSIR
jgi:hypothetical protein